MAGRCAADLQESTDQMPAPTAHFATGARSLEKGFFWWINFKRSLQIRPGTTGLVADRMGRDAILIELNREYAVDLAYNRIVGDAPLLCDVELHEV